LRDEKTTTTLVFTALSTVVLFACVASKAVTVDAVSYAKRAGRTAYLLVGDHNAGEHRAPEFREFARAALVQRGFEPVEPPAAADIIVIMSWSSSAPELRTAQVMRPVTSYEAPRQSTVDVQTYDRYGMPQGSATGSVRENGRFVTSYVPATVSKFVTSHWVYLQAYSIREIERWASENRDAGAPTAPPGAIWAVSAGATDNSGDLRALFPWLMRASVPYLGRNTEGMERVEVNKDQVDALRALVAPIER
jgi:hypothetical protein